MSISMSGEGDEVPLDLERYAPFYLTSISNRWTASSSRLYLRDFGIGVADWRVLVSIAVKGGASSLDIVNLVGLDPGAVSRAIRNLEARGFVVPIPGRYAGRTKPYRMTDKGWSLHNAVREVAMKREALLLNGLSPAERDQLVALLKKVHAGLDVLQA